MLKRKKDTCKYIKGTQGFKSEKNIVFAVYSPLTFTTFWANSADNKLTIFFLVFPETEALMFRANSVCMKCQSLFSGKIRKVFRNVVC